jgi:DNA recombination protein RmuC
MLTLFNILIILGGLILVYLLLKKDIEKLISQSKDSEAQKFLDLQNKIIESFSFLENFKNSIVKEIQEYFNTTIEKQEKIVETTSKIEELTRNLESSAIEIKTFKEILAGPKNRGFLGEIMLEEIIKNLPSSFYEKQYQLGFDRVDYVLKINDLIIPIDAKFPVQNFSQISNLDEKNKQSLKKELIRNLKNKIEDISRKYILPSRGTVEFALMYLANEGIYYELLSDKDYAEVWDFAREKSVFLTSPKNFELICSSLLLVIRKQELGQNIQQILMNLHQLEKDLLELSQQFETSYKQLKYSFSNLQEFERILNRFIINYRSLLKSEEKLEQKIKERSLI